MEPDAIFIKSGNTYTSGGVAAGIDLALALVEEDHGADLARSVAQGLLVYMQRAGGQSQFSASLRGPAPKTALVRSVVNFINENPSRQHTVMELADFASVSARHLNRLFREELDSTPSEYAAVMRFDRAKALLDRGHAITTTATESGFSSPEALRRAFIARLGISPLKYQQRFRSTNVDGK
ncbi:helix-turn-helix domain-containing protein [Glaciihabitans sp. dw_435]|uniref:GlxA family transcriptional regulator n=1 Tax=Glaciihabitans sp. dw_435 TaxID=2720081 RepID=UPI0027DBF584|nr:helix-turn-helix domain-containing protein [Glaciihabitans sp. dw_435]